IVPGPVRRQHEIAGGHREARAVDDRIAALALDDQAQGRARVAMGARDLAGITIWMLATMVLLADRPGSSGLVSRSTRRSACSVPTRRAARIAWGRKSRQCHTHGTALLLGSRVIPPPIQAGVMCWDPSCA